jgi:hypothetical protein
MAEQLSRGNSMTSHDVNANQDNFFNGFVATGKQLGVSDNAVRKFLRR